MDEAVSNLVVLHSLFSLPDELEIIALPPDTVEPLLGTGIWEEEVLRGAVDSTASRMSLRVRVHLQEREDCPVFVAIHFPVEDDPTHTSDRAFTRLIQPACLSRGVCDAWQFELDSLPSSGSAADDVSTAIERIRELGELQPLGIVGLDPGSGSTNTVDETGGPLERVWFWFPSLSTKEKRKDLVVYAKERGITGFVMAGKPGLLCAEGQGSIIDKYMAAIKSESWSDIPSYQKKVTERYREPVTDRAFPDMTEITDEIAHNGWRGAKSDMSEVRDYLTSKGVGDAFGKVVGSGGFG